MSAELRAGPIARLWEWLGWKSPRIAAQRVEAIHVRESAQARHESAVVRASRSSSMADWLARRSEQNHIVEALQEALDHPRRRRA